MDFAGGQGSGCWPVFSQAPCRFARASLRWLTTSVHKRGCLSTPRHQGSCGGTDERGRPGASWLVGAATHDKHRPFIQGACARLQPTRDSLSLGAACGDGVPRRCPHSRLTVGCAARVFGMQVYHGPNGEYAESKRQAVLLASGQPLTAAQLAFKRKPAPRGGGGAASHRRLSPPVMGVPASGGVASVCNVAASREDSTTI